MGQAESQLKGSYTFAYQINNLAATAPASAAEEIVEYENDDNNDQVLKNPEVYGLRIASSSYPFLPPSLSPTQLLQSPSTLNQQHRDSGYVSPFYYDESLHLMNDLSYIDTTYYNNFSRRKPSSAIKTTDQQQQQQQQTKGIGAHISFTDVMLSSPNNDLREVYLACRSIHSLSPDIGMLTMIRKLDLSNNYLTELPDTIGYMQHLQVLNISKNQLTVLPDTIGYLSNLQDLDVSYNEIQQLTPFISYLENLKTLSLAYNQIHSLPTAISGLINLISLDLTRNPLKVLPAEISQLPYLRRMRLEDCPFIIRQQDQEYSLVNDPPSLLEMCARTIKREKNIATHILPQHLQNYLQTAKSCTSCHGPYFESFVLRGRLMEKTDLHIPLEYSLCSAHWSNNVDRILSMFSNQPCTSIDSTRSYRPDLPALPKLRGIQESNNSKLSFVTALLRNKRQPPAPPAPAAPVLLPAAAIIDHSHITTMDTETTTNAFDAINDINEALLAPALSSTTSKLFSSRSSSKSKLVMNLSARFKRSVW